jgi:predicted acyltransferase
VSSAGVLFGYWTGRLLRSSRREIEKRLGLAVAGLGAVAVGLVWSARLPINKRMWTPSYLLLMTGLSLAVVLVCHVCFDRQTRLARWSSLPLRALGTNAIVVYVGSELSAAALAHYHHDVGPVIGAPVPFWLWARYLTPPFGLKGGALAYGVGILLAWWVVAAVMFRRRWFLRV